VNQTFRQFLFFCFNGVLNTIANLIVFQISLDLFNLTPFFCGSFGFLSGAVVGYILNRKLTFKSQIGFFNGFSKYLIIQGLCLAIHLTTMWWTMEFLNAVPIHAQLGGIGVTTIINFILSKFFVFRVNP